MNKFRRQALLTIFKLFDLIVMITMFMLAASMVYFQSNVVTFHEFLQMRFKVENYLLFSGLIFLGHLIFSWFGLYKSRRISSIKIEIKDLLIAITLYTVLIYISSRVFNMETITPVFLVVFWGGTSMATIISRLLMRSTLKWIRLKGRNLRHILIAGTNERARNFARKIESKPEFGYKLLGFVDQNWEGNGDLQEYGWTLVSNFQDFTSYIRHNVVDEVVIALPMKSLYGEASQIFAACEEQGIIVKNLSDIFNLKSARFRPVDIDGLPLTSSHYTGAMDGWQVVAKRLFDILVSSALLVILAPLAIIVAIAIKIDSPGPVHFTHERVGLNKRRFRLYKFRTMVEGAEQKQVELECFNEVGGPVFKIKNDPRITSVGKILRKTSIDEIPQLINVIKGDMSLVGPRPLPVRDYNGFNHDWHRRRFSVRPGMTCLWQIAGRSSIPFEEWMDLDLQYIDQWSLRLDLRILAKTIPAVLSGSGAA